MTEEPARDHDRIGIVLPTSHFVVTPGRSTIISFTLVNRSPDEDYIEYSVRGVPMSWITLPGSQVIRLASGERREVQMTVQPPPSPQVEAGEYALVVRVASQEDPDPQLEVELTLEMAPYQGEEGFALRLEENQYSVTPGRSTTVHAQLSNLGGEAETFRLNVVGLAEDWLTFPSRTISVDPGEEVRASFAISPPRGAESRAGRHPFTIQATSQSEPVETREVDATLTIAAFSAFTARIHPAEIRAGRSAWVEIENLGNFPETFTVTLESEDRALAFDPERFQPVQLPPGESTSLEFVSSPQVFFSLVSEARYPFRARVRSSQDETKTFSAEVRARSTFPLWWVFPAVVILCLSLIWITIFFLDVNRNALVRATQTAAARATSQMGTALAQGALEADVDNDGLNTLQELERGTDPNLADTDGDGLLDGQEATLGTNPLQADMDNDGLTDREELERGLAPDNPDTDGDGLTDRADPNPLDPTNPALTASAQPSLTPTTPPLTETPVPPSPTPTQTPTNTPIVTTPATVPFQGLGTIVFESSRQDNREIYALDTQTFGLARLTISPGVDTQPVLSPDGARIAFSTNRDGNFEIYVMTADGTAVTNLTNHPADDVQPAWSPDGDWIAFSSNRDGNQEVHVMRSDGTDVQNISNNPAEDFGPTWLSDQGLFSDEQIAFTTNRDGNLEVYAMQTDGESPFNLTNHPADDFSPVAAPNGDRLVFITSRDGNMEVYRMERDGTGPTNLTNHPADDFNASWSPNNIWIAFATERDGNPEVYVMRANGTEFYRLTDDAAEDLYPTWR